MTFICDPHDSKNGLKMLQVCSTTPAGASTRSGTVTRFPCAVYEAALSSPGVDKNCSWRSTHVWLGRPALFSLDK
jgi:hypothetical protein